jgi:hypothetical protein
LVQTLGILGIMVQTLGQTLGILGISVQTLGILWKVFALKYFRYFRYFRYFGSNFRYLVLILGQTLGILGILGILTVFYSMESRRAFTKLYILRVYI